jgi:hypothetical protein
VIALSDARHHTAHREIIIVPMPYPVPVPIPVETPAAGSPKIGRIMKPRYPSRSDRPEHWRPARAIPGRGKAAALQRFLDYMRHQDEIVREVMKPDASILRAWLERRELLV